MRQTQERIQKDLHRSIGEEHPPGYLESSYPPLVTSSRVACCAATVPNDTCIQNIAMENALAVNPAKCEVLINCLPFQRVDSPTPACTLVDQPLLLKENVRYFSSLFSC